MKIPQSTSSIYDAIAIITKHPIYKALRSYLPSETEMGYKFKGTEYYFIFYPDAFYIRKLDSQIKAYLPLKSHSDIPYTLRLLQSLATYLSKKNKTDSSLVEDESLKQGAESGADKSQTGSSLDPKDESQQAFSSKPEGLAKVTQSDISDRETDQGIQVEEVASHDGRPGCDDNSTSAQPSGLDEAGQRTDDGCRPAVGTDSSLADEGKTDGQPGKAGENAESQSLGVYTLADVLKSDKGRMVGGGGGGRQLDTTSAAVSPSKRIQEAILLLASGEDISRKEDGYLYFDSKKAGKAVTYNHKSLLLAKYRRPVDRVYFFVDTSGSVSMFGEFIIKMILSTKTSEQIEVWSGSEAHPEKDEKRGMKIIEYEHSFLANMKKWLSLLAPEPGSTLVFWGDLHAVHIRGEEAQIKKLLSPYRCIWLHCCDECDYKGCETDAAIRAGFKLLRRVNNESRLVATLKTIRR